MERPEHRVSKAHGARKEPKVPRVQQGLQVQWELPVFQECKEPKVHKAQWARKECRASKDRKEHKAPREPKAIKAYLATKVFQERLGLPAHKDHKVPKDHKAPVWGHKDHKAHKAHKAHRETLAQTDLKESRVLRGLARRAAARSEPITLASAHSLFCSILLRVIYAVVTMLLLTIRIRGSRPS